MSQPSSIDPIANTSRAFQVETKPIESETTNLEQCLGVANDIKEPTPPSHLRLACTAYHHVKRRVEMVQKLNHSRENAASWVGLDAFQICLCLHDCVKEDFKCMSEEGQFLVVRSKDDRLLSTAGFEVMQKDMVEEKVRLRSVQQSERKYCRIYEHLWTGGTSQREGSSSQLLRALPR